MFSNELNIWNVLPGAERAEIPRGSPGEIFAYTDRISYASGARIELYVHTTARTFNVEVIRDGAVPAVVHRLSRIPGIAQRTRDNPAVHGCGWTDPVVLVPDVGWGSGPFVVRLTTDDHPGSEAHAFFVLKPAKKQERAMALVLTTSTWTAYNDWGGANNYRSIRDGAARDVPEPVLSLHRPWVRGFLHLPPEAPRHADEADLPIDGRAQYPFYRWAFAHGYSPHYSDAGWAYFERPFVVWAQSAGYEFDVLTQADLHQDPDCLSPYDVMLLVGHDEYWTWEMRDTLDHWLVGGGCLARFGGNMAMQVRLENDATVQVCYRVPGKDPEADTNPRRATTHWESARVGRPAATTFGLSGFSGIYVRFGYANPRASGGYTVYRPEHWSLAGTDLYYGDLLGAGDSRIAAFEVDGLDYTFRDGLPFPTDRDSPPPGLEIIAMTPAAFGEENRHKVNVNSSLSSIAALNSLAPFSPPRTEDSLRRGSGMMVAFAKEQGEVFNAGCCNWVTGLMRGDRPVETVTHNVLRRFLAHRKR